MKLIVNIDVPDLAAAEAFYTAAFDLAVTRRFDGVVELTGESALFHLLEKAPGTTGAGGDPRRYDRHWSPVHLDILVEDLDMAVDRATAAGALVERRPPDGAWGRIANMADPFGHGFCLIQLLNRGYDELT
ncbi:VOC family protein [Caulobacter mirabilis]|uniref:Glyoxalase n=1 Tax=Caulobacter mirabilis TaxID=69666 RepID=A0A2D2AVP1_9CAUL|nr:VOC family protein [Caulobacter mirabilis]ATQ42045.1 glyoxalase [Caulobacter mirabilis]